MHHAYVYPLGAETEEEMYVLLVKDLKKIVSSVVTKVRSDFNVTETHDWIRKQQQTLFCRVTSFFEKWNFSHCGQKLSMLR